MTSPRTSNRLVTLALSLLLAAAAALAPAARADDFVDKVNAAFKGIPDSKRSDLVVLPALAAMDKPPAVLGTQEHAGLLFDKGPGWTECADWAQKPAQKAVLEAIAKVTQEEDRLQAYVFAQPYGVDGVSLDLVQKEMYTEIGSDALLAAARHLYMPALENAGILCNVEASRLLAAGDAPAAITVMTNWLFFCRQMADRPFLKEKKWAMESMRTSLERIRDLAFVDFRAEKHSMDVAKVKEFIRRLRGEVTLKKDDKKEDLPGFLALDRLTIPEGDFIAREQLINIIMEVNGGTKPATFATTMARVASVERPLRLFSDAAYWEQIRTGHKGYRETLNMLRGLHDDWGKRWQLSAFDRLQQTFTDYKKSVRNNPKYAVLQMGLADAESLFPLRTQLRAEAGGTRMGIAAYGSFIRQKVLPRSLASLRPEFFETPLDTDPYSQKKPPTDLLYFIPVLDTPRGPNGEEVPYVVTFWPDSRPSFQYPGGKNNFVIYSVGPDGEPTKCLNVTQAREHIKGDYLLWPPTLSVYRQYDLERNQLK
jgi:hypothetical protein